MVDSDKIKTGLAFAMIALIAGCGRSPSPATVTKTPAPAAAASPSKTELTHDDEKGTLKFEATNSKNNISIDEKDVEKTQTSDDFVGFTRRHGGGALYQKDGTEIVDSAKVASVVVSPNASGYVLKNGEAQIFFIYNAGQPSSTIQKINIQDVLDLQITDNYVGYIDKASGGHIFEYRNSAWSEIIKDPTISKISLAKYFYGYLAKGGGMIFTTKDEPITKKNVVTDVWITDGFAGYRTIDRSYYLRTNATEIVKASTERQLVVSKNFAGYVTDDNQAVIVDSKGKSIFKGSGISQLWLSDSFYAVNSEEEKKGELRDITGKLLATFDLAYQISVSNNFAGYIDRDHNGAIFKRDGTKLSIPNSNLKDIETTDHFVGYITLESSGQIWTEYGDVVDSGISWKSMALSNQFAAYLKTDGLANFFSRAGQNIFNADKVRTIFATDTFAGYLNQWANMSDEGTLRAFGIFKNDILVDQKVTKVLAGKNYLAFLKTSLHGTLFTLDAAGNVEPQHSGVSFFEFNGNDLIYGPNSYDQPYGNKNLPTHLTLSN